MRNKKEKGRRKKDKNKRKAHKTIKNKSTDTKTERKERHPSSPKKGKPMTLAIIVLHHRHA